MKTLILLSALLAFVSGRPAPEERLFTSQAVEATIDRIQSLLTNEKLAWMFGNCFPNTLDTTVHYREDEDGQPDLLNSL